MKTLYNKFDKKILSQLPRAVFPGRIITILNAAEAEKAVAYLSTFRVLGVDTETRPAFKKGHVNAVALLQISTEDTCFLFRLNRIGITPSLIRLFENPSVLKVGLSLRDDLAALRKRQDFHPESFVDLQNLVRNLGVEDMSLQKIYANFFGEKISKGQRLTNWEADVLTDGQQLYAATDAWACVRLYQEYGHLRETGDYTLHVRESLPAGEQEK